MISRIELRWIHAVLTRNSVAPLLLEGARAVVVFDNLRRFLVEISEPLGPGEILRGMRDSGGGVALGGRSLVGAPRSSRGEPGRPRGTATSLAPVAAADAAATVAPLVEDAVSVVRDHAVPFLKGFVDWYTGSG